MNNAPTNLIRWICHRGGWLQLTASLLAALIGAVDAGAQNALLPQGREPTVLAPGTRNPFGQAVTAQETTVMESTETEEMRLRRILGGIKVGGVSGTPEHLRVLLGSLILKPGDTLPQLVEDQQEVIRVASISGSMVELAFVDKEAGAELRLIRIPIKTPPRVTEMLYGEALERLTSTGSAPPAKGGGLPLKGVQDFLEGSKQAELLNVTERKFELMGVPNDAEKPKQDE